MPHSNKDQFAPRWVVVIYIVSLLEALGLSIYFRADLPDPEMASMQPQYVDMQQAPTRMAGQPACDHCLLLARSRHPESVEELTQKQN